jgi:hypothetical protein
MPTSEASNPSEVYRARAEEFRQLIGGAQIYYERESSRLQEPSVVENGALFYRPPHCEVKTADKGKD